MHYLALLNSPAHSAAPSGPAGLFIPSIAGLAAAVYGLWMITKPDKFLRWLEHRLQVLADNPYRFDPVRLENKRRALMNYVYSTEPIRKIRRTGIKFIIGAVIFELLIWLSFLLIH